MPKRIPFGYFKTSPEIIRLAVMTYVRFPLSAPGVGKIYCHERPERMARYTSAGEQIKKDVDKVVKVTVAKALKDRINT